MLLFSIGLLDGFCPAPLSGFNDSLSITDCADDFFQRFAIIVVYVDL
jgi:hypothetical protein